MEEAKRRSNDMKKFYVDAVDEWDPAWPKPQGEPVTVTTFVDANHASDKINRRSSTGLIIFIQSTPYKWFTKRQTSTEAATFGSEFMALRVAVEQTIGLIHTLRSIGIKVKTPVSLFCDNRGVVDNCSRPGSPLQKKHLSIAYHLVRQAHALGLIFVFHINSEDNPADILTKSVSHYVFKRHIHCNK